MIDIIKLYTDFHIPFQSGGGRGVAKGWVGISCPFCTGNPGYHLGYCIDITSRYAGAYTCWRCGGKSAVQVIARLTNSTNSESYKIIKRYSTSQTIKDSAKRVKIKKSSKCSLPPGSTSMNSRQRDYLRKRKFKVKELISIWDLKGTGPVGPYKNRIIIPIYFKNELVSYQGRDITNRSKTRYKACPKELEVRDHKHCLYGYDKTDKNKVIVVEGVTDVWRLGPGAVATFGVKYTTEQLYLLSKFKEVFVLFDSDEAGTTQSELLVKQLSNLGVYCEIISLKEGDPGELSQKDADLLMSDILR